MRFLIGIALGLVPAIAFAITGRLFLASTYESVSYERIVRDQLAAHGIYASALHDDFYEYKLALYRATKPTVVGIGSSRAWELQAFGFRVPFVTLGGGMRSIEDGERLLADMKASGPMPQVAILGIDYWWFNEHWSSREHDADRVSRIDSWFGAPFRPAMWLSAGKIGLRNFVSVALYGPPRHGPFPPAFGVSALYSLHGFAVDGHYRYLGDAFGVVVGDDHFRNEQEQIPKGGSRYVFGETPSESAILRFEALVRAFEASGTHVIVFSPPVADLVRTKIREQGEKLAYIDRTFDRLRRDGFLEYEFHDASTIGATDCEFVDGYHSGEVMYLRIVLAIASDPASGLERYVDRDVLRSTIERTKGHVLTDGAAFAPYKEQDFLKLGCSK